MLGAFSVSAGGVLESPRHAENRKFRVRWSCFRADAAGTAIEIAMLAPIFIRLLFGTVA
jgi:hypothetical protein